MLIRIAFFRLQNPLKSGLRAVLVLLIPFFIETYFDSSAINAPLWLTAIPVLGLFLASAASECWQTFFEARKSRQFFYGYHSPIRKVSSTLNLFAVLLFCFTMISNLFYLELSLAFPQITNKAVSSCLYSSFIFAVLIMDFSGALVCKKLFAQFEVSMMTQ